MVKIENDKSIHMEKQARPLISVSRRNGDSGFPYFLPEVLCAHNKQP
jgi:hypothetical protein